MGCQGYAMQPWAAPQPANLLLITNHFFNLNSQEPQLHCYLIPSYSSDFCMRWKLVISRSKKKKEKKRERERASVLLLSHWVSSYRIRHYQESLVLSKEIYIHMGMAWSQIQLPQLIFNCLTQTKYTKRTMQICI